MLLFQADRVFAFFGIGKIRDGLWHSNHQILSSVFLLVELNKIDNREMLQQFGNIPKVFFLAPAQNSLYFHGDDVLG